MKPPAIFPETWPVGAPVLLDVSFRENSTRENVQ